MKSLMPSWNRAPVGLIAVCMIWQSTFAQEVLLDNHPDSCRLYVSISGRFNAQSEWDVNLINAPVDEVARRPGRIDISDSALTALNGSVEAVLLSILTSKDWKYSRLDDDYYKWKMSAPPVQEFDDRYFRLHLWINGSNPLGGQYGGLDVRIQWTSLHRNPNLLYGLGFTRLGVPPPGMEVKHLEEALRHALEEALSDWRSGLRDERMRPRRSFTLHVHPDDLSDAPFRYFLNSVLPCVHDQLAGFDFLKETDKDKSYVVHYRLGHGETESEFIERYAETMRMAVGTHGKYACSLWKTPLERYRPIVRTDSTSRTVEIRWQADE